MEPFPSLFPSLSFSVYISLFLSLSLSFSLSSVMDQKCFIICVPSQQGTNTPGERCARVGRSRSMMYTGVLSLSFLLSLPPTLFFSLSVLLFVSLSPSFPPLSLSLSGCSLQVLSLPLFYLLPVFQSLSPSLSLSLSLLMISTGAVRRY
jgi:hypothetical protein